MSEKRGERMITVSIPSLEKNTGSEGEEEHRWKCEKADGETRGFRDPGEPFGQESKTESGENNCDRSVEGQG